MASSVRPRFGPPCTEDCKFSTDARAELHPISPTLPLSCTPLWEENTPNLLPNGSHLHKYAAHPGPVVPVNPHRQPSDGVDDRPKLKKHCRLSFQLPDTHGTSLHSEEQGWDVNGTETATASPRRAAAQKISDTFLASPIDRGDAQEKEISGRKSRVQQMESGQNQSEYRSLPIHTTEERFEAAGREEDRSGARCTKSQWREQQVRYKQSNENTCACLEHNRVKQLREGHETQGEVITELKIRIAVLENELKHSERDKQDAINSSAVLARVLGPNLSSLGIGGRADQEDRDKWSQKIMTLKLENATLWKLLKDKGVGISYDSGFSSASEDSSSPPNNASSCDKPRNQEVPKTDDKYPRSKVREHPKVQHDADQKTSPKASVQVDLSYGAEASVRASSSTEKAEGQSACLSEKEEELTKISTPCANRNGIVTSSSSEYRTQNIWDESFQSGSTTVPNSPVTSFFSNVKHLPTTSQPVKTSQLPPPTKKSDIKHQQPSLPLVDRATDVGFESLEDILGCPMDGFPPPKLALLTPVDEEREARAGKSLLDQENCSDVEHLASVGQLEILLPPGILKTGFQVEGSFRGAEYDYSKSETLSFDRSFPMRSKRKLPFNHFLPLTRNSSKRSDSLAEASSLYSSEEQCQAAFDIHKRSCGPAEFRYPDLFRYGIRFVPGESNSDCFRTVHITNFPADIELRDVLARVRGGQIVQAILADTVPLTGSRSVLVQFMHERAAERYFHYALEHPITLGEGDNARTADITLLQTPTWPMKYSIRRAVEKFEQTRMLSIPNFPEDFSIDLLQETLTYGNGHRANLLVEIFLSNRNTLHLGFSSITAAGAAFGILTNFDTFRGLDVCFEPDPCAGPLEELQSPVPPKPPVFPPHLSLSLQDFQEDTPFSSLTDKDKAQAGEVSPPHHSAGDRIATPYKRLAALSNQKVVIPSFSGKDIKSSSWADEVNDEFDIAAPTFQVEARTSSSIEEHIQSPPREEQHHLAVPPPSPPSPHESSIVTKLMNVEDFDVAMTTKQFRNPPVGLAGSKYASPVSEDPAPARLYEPLSPLNQFEALSPTETSDIIEEDQLSIEHLHGGGDVLPVNSETASEPSFSRSARHTEVGLCSGSSAKTLPRVNHGPIFGPSTSSCPPSIHYTSSTSYHDTLTEHKTKLQAETPPVYESSQLQRGTVQTYSCPPSPDLQKSDRKYSPKREWPKLEPHSVAGSHPFEKEVYQETPSHCQHEEEPLIPNPNTPLQESCAESSTDGDTDMDMDGDNVLAHSVSLIQEPAVSSFQNADAGSEKLKKDLFILGRELLDDPFIDRLPHDLPPPAKTPLPVREVEQARGAVMNLDEIELDLDLDEDAYGEAVVKEFVMRKPDLGIGGGGGDEEREALLVTPSHPETGVQIEMMLDSDDCEVEME